MLNWIKGKLAGKPKAFDIGKPNRRLAAIPANVIAINALIQKYGKTTVARSRYLCTNNAYAAAAKAAYMTAMAGDGVRPVSMIQDAERKRIVTELFNDWTEEADADGQTGYYGLQARIAGEQFEGGECFIRVRPRRERDGLTVPFQLQILPTEMLPLADTYFARVQGGNTIKMGIEFNAIGQRVAYHFLRTHPGEIVTDANVFRADTVRVPANEILHAFNPLRAGQLRGIPHTVSALMPLAILDLYDDAELERKRVAALFAVFVTRPGVTTDAENDDHPLGGTLLKTYSSEESQFQMTPGANIDLLPGEDVKFSEPADVGGGYEAFQYRTLTRVSAGMQIPYSIVTNDLKGVNFSTMREERIKFRQRINAQQRNNFIPQVGNPVWRAFHEFGTVSGVMPWTATEFDANRREFMSKQWILPRWPWVDPVKDMQAEILAVDNKFKARSDVIMESGQDPEEMARRIVADEERFGTVDKALKPPQDDPEEDPEEKDPNNPEEDPEEEEKTDDE